ncbi:MAG: Two-component transcriptional response regulator, LuxR family [uncultured Adhaeribacter sp.]|uniref:Two-component transcriptional response regulator, LuxR family n=1 Tax=uncultured Adhaeribacter sp. TaxID=448109 RepID=A0A6J4IMA1_9BACT|nr:MAG: Two-component transcriptional response regulator, LuxR family [uncultured Adhaeribacter sp.]
MRCLAIDDEPKALAIIRHYAEKVPGLVLLGEFRSGVDALQFLHQEPADLIFLDINMPDLTGIELLQTLSRPPLVIFTTAYSEYAVQSYDWDAVGYLLKPIEFSKFLKAVNKAQARLAPKYTPAPTALSASPAAGYILIKSGVQTYQVKLTDILYAEASGNHVVLVTPERKIIALCSLQELTKLLPAPVFFRIHKSYIVALPHVAVIESYQVKIKNCAIPIGKTYREAFLRLFKP